LQILALSLVLLFGSAHEPTALKGLRLFRSGDVKKAVPILETAARQDTEDWVTLQHLGAAYGMMARKLAHAAEQKQGDVALRMSTNFFKKAEIARARLATDVEYPQADFAQPRTLVLRGWGDALAWLNRPKEARDVFQLGVQEGFWQSTWCRPVLETATRLLPTNSFVLPASLFPHIVIPVKAALKRIRKEFSRASKALKLASAEQGGGWRLEAAGLHVQRTW
jgi:hypothetical protein